MQIDPGDSTVIAATSNLTLLAFTLPTLGADWQDAALPAHEPTPDESVADPV